VLEDPVLFSSTGGTNMPIDGRELSPEDRIALGYDVQIAAIDPPVHGVKRRPFNKHFTVPAAERLRETIAAIVEDILVKLSAKDELDLVSDIAAPLPQHLFLAMLGVPQKDWEYLRNLANARRSAQDQAVRDGSDAKTTHLSHSQELYRYVEQHTMKRRGAAEDDFASLIANMEVGGSLLGRRDAGWMTFALVAGGLETTRNAAAVGIAELMRRPRDAAAIHDPQIAKTAVEEVLRWATPTKNKLRVATRDTEIRGRKIAKGDWVVPWLSSANRDPDVFEDPDNFDIYRDPNPHLTFGFGEHHCLGRNIARLELQLLLPMLFAAFPNLAPAGPIEWAASDFTTEIKRLPLQLNRRPQAAAPSM
jgi:cholest-4-en-3-one 26-monooxygenase